MNHKYRILLGVIFLFITAGYAYYIYRLIHTPSCYYTDERIIGKSFVINLPERKEKLERVKHNLRSIPNLQRCEGIIATEDGKSTLPLGAYGCYLAHEKVLKEIATLPSYIDSKEVWYIIFEDDVEPFEPETFYTDIKTTISHLPKNTHGVNLGAGLNSWIISMYLRNAPNIYNLYKGWNMYLQAYAITVESAKEMLSVIKIDNYSTPIDVLWVQHYKDTSKVYFRNLSTQYRGNNTNKDTFGSDRKNI